MTSAPLARLYASVFYPSTGARTLLASAERVSVHAARREAQARIRALCIDGARLELYDPVRREWRTDGRWTNDPDVAEAAERMAERARDVETRPKRKATDGPD